MFLYLLTLGLDEKQKEQITDIYFEYGNLMKAVALRYFKDPNKAKDISQEAFYKIKDNLKKILSLECNERRNYIVNIVKSVSIDTIRKESRWKKRSISLEEMEIEVASKECSVEEYLMIQERKANITEQMLRLPKQDAILLKAKYYHKCSTKEICDMLDIESEGTVRSMIFRARKKLYKLMDERDFEL